MKLTKLLIHQKNPVSFSYARDKFTQSQFISSYIPSLQEEVISSRHWSNLHFVKNNTYQFTENQGYTRLNPKFFERTYFQYEPLYYFLLEHLKLNRFDLNCQNSNCTVPPTQQDVKYVVSTFQPEDTLECNDDYYQVFIKGCKNPLYFGLQTNLFDNDGNVKSLLDIVYRTGKRKILGLTSNHELKTFEIQSVKNLSSEDEPLDLMETPFYEIGVTIEDKKPILCDNILVSLD